MANKMSRLCVALALGILPSDALAFQGFYSTDNTASPPSSFYARQAPRKEEMRPALPVPRATPDVAMPDPSACIAAIAAAESNHGIPQNLLLAIGLQEAGLKHEGQLTIWPWTINSQGIGYRFDTKAEAIAFARDEIAQGRTSFDVGCFQINLRWHPDAFDSLDEAFDPTRNAAYAARFLRQLRNDTSDWLTAAGNYHSRTPEHHARYTKGIGRNLQVALNNKDHFAALGRTEAVQIAQHMADPSSSQSAASLEQNTPGRSLRRSASIDRDRLLASDALRNQIARRDRKQALQEQDQVPRPTQPDRPATDNQESGAWWMSELNGQSSEGSKRTIYSTSNIEPVLPDLIDARSLYEGMRTRKSP